MRENWFPEEGEAIAVKKFMFVSEMSVSSPIVKDEMSVGTTIFSFPWTFPSQELVIVVRELHCPGEEALVLIFLFSVHLIQEVRQLRLRL